MCLAPLSLPRVRQAALRTARMLQQALGGSVEFWMSRDFQYRKDVSRIHAADREWLSFGRSRSVPPLLRRADRLRVASDIRGALGRGQVQDVAIIRLPPCGGRRVASFQFESSILGIWRYAGTPALTRIQDGGVRREMKPGPGLAIPAHDSGGARRRGSRLRRDRGYPHRG